MSEGRKIKPLSYLHVSAKSLYFNHLMLCSKQDLLRTQGSPSGVPAIAGCISHLVPSPDPQLLLCPAPQPYSLPPGWHGGLPVLESFASTVLCFPRRGCRVGTVEALHGMSGARSLITKWCARWGFSLNMVIFPEVFGHYWDLSYFLSTWHPLVMQSL